MAPFRLLTIHKYHRLFTGAYESFEPPKISPQDPIRGDGDYGVSKTFGEARTPYYCALED